VRLDFTPDAVREVARIAADVNSRMENIGARRLHTVMTTLLEDIMFDLPDNANEGVIRVDGAFVRNQLKSVLEDEDLRRYIL
jgi:ATP-dependent HslUV protease ATP-binding subunit HslU